MAITQKTIYTAIFILILIVVFISILPELITEFQTSLAGIAALNVPLASFFSPTGVLILILMAVIVLFVLAALFGWLPGMKGKKR